MADAAAADAAAADAAGAAAAAAAAAAATGPAPELAAAAAVQLGPKAYFYAPAAAAAPRPPAHPVAVVVCAWMGAAPRHVAKYVAAHRELYPATCILVVTVSLGDFLRSSAARRTDMDVAVATLRAALAASPPPSPSPSPAPAPAPVLVHVFSNGGSLRLHDLASCYRATAQPPAPLPAACVVYDSAPGSPQYRRDVTAIMAAVPRRPRLLRLALAVLVRVAVLVMSFFASRLSDRVRAGLNDPALVSRAAPRCYIYSAEDDAVDPKHVEAHAFQASRAGMTVATHRFHGSGHVAHMRLDPVRYWDIVRRAWNEAVR